MRIYFKWPYLVTICIGMATSHIYETICETDEIGSPRAAEDEGVREEIDKLIRTEEENVCADCGKKSM